jgi:hypothetical protein
VTEKEWITKALETQKIHLSNLKADVRWRLQDTARLLGYSIGNVSQDLLIAKWLRIDDSVKKFEYARDALSYIKTKERKLKLDRLNPLSDRERYA